MISGDFPSFEMADGKGQLNFNLDSNGSQETVKFKFSLKDAKKGFLMRDISESQKKVTLEISVLIIRIFNQKMKMKN